MYVSVSILYTCTASVPQDHKLATMSFWLHGNQHTPHTASVAHGWLTVIISVHPSSNQFEDNLYLSEWTFFCKWNMKTVPPAVYKAGHKMGCGQVAATLICFKILSEQTKKRILLHVWSYFFSPAEPVIAKVLAGVRSGVFIRCSVGERAVWVMYCHHDTMREEACKKHFMYPPPPFRLLYGNTIISPGNTIVYS